MLFWHQKGWRSVVVLQIKYSPPHPRLPSDSTTMQPLNDAYSSTNIPSTSLAPIPSPSVSNPFISTPSTSIPHGTSTLSPQFSAFESRSLHQSTPSSSHPVSTKTAPPITPGLRRSKRTVHPPRLLIEEM